MCFKPCVHNYYTTCVALKNYMKFAAGNKKRKTGQSHSEKIVDDPLSGQKLVHCYNNYFESLFGVSLSDL